MASTEISGYTAYRRDRVDGRRAGGVVIYIRAEVPSARCTELHHSAYEVIWIRSLLNSLPLYLAALYHPPSPRPRYKDEEFIAYIEDCLNTIAQQQANATIIWAGDCNQLSDDAVCALGLHSLVKQPTHMGSKLERVYCTAELYNNIKVLSSAIKTKHSMVVARSDCKCIVDSNKKTFYS